MVKANGEQQSDETSAESANGQQLWPMGAVTRRTGITEHTLRAWERRFGFPDPHRLESGHRRYPVEQVQRLLLVAKALDFGYRAGDVVPLPPPALRDLLRDAGVYPTAAGPVDEGGLVTAVFEASRRFDRASLSGLLRREASILGTSRFVSERVAPLLHEVGEAWVRGELEIRHEHFFSEVLEDELRALRVPLQASAGGHPVLLATLPNELHSLGLQIAALGIVAKGRAVHVLGPQMPVEEIVSAAQATEAAAVGLSVSLFAPEDETVSELTAVRAGLPEDTQLWLGGGGAAALEGLPAGVTLVATAEELERALAGLGG
jgi:methanogenic corrinoid protein MtbC1